MGELTIGRATADGTARYAARAAAADGHFRRLGDVSLSSVGLGTYLGRDDDATDVAYREAIARALALGCNVLDSAINYRGQRSEVAVGAALRDAFARGVVARDEVVVATKGGFIPRGMAPPRETVAGCHVMTPAWIEDQLARSRHNLGLATIDVYYLHNPETQLEEVSQSELLRRFHAVAEVLERAASDGWIGWWGTATWNGYRVGPNDRGHLPLAEMLAAARAVGGEGHRFRVLQLPYNLGMHEALTRPTQGGRPVLDVAAEAGMYVMTSASVLQGKLTRGLPEATSRLGAELTDAARSIQFVRSTPGVGTALVGMSKVAHVEENLSVARVPPLPGDVIRGLMRR